MLKLGAQGMEVSYALDPVDRHIHRPRGLLQIRLGERERTDFPYLNITVQRLKQPNPEPTCIPLREGTLDYVDKAMASHVTDVTA